MKHTFDFDPVKHIYRIDGRIVPGVTAIIDRVLGRPIMRATDWHMQRGAAVHACAAMIARGIEFENDPQIDGQVAAVRKFFADFKPVPRIIETPAYSVAYQYGGTIDLITDTEMGLTLVDYKATISVIRGEIQLGGYALLHPDVKAGLLVQPNEDGTYKVRPVPSRELRLAKQDFLSIRGSYGILQRLGETESRKEGNA
jgi:hypothetical protein